MLNVREQELLGGGQILALSNILLGDLRFAIDFERRGRQVSKSGKMPVTKIRSKVPSPLIEATGAPKPRTAPRFIKSAPINVPKLPAA